ncbi:hypothetical protein SDC9_62023 [bioreactor metagenome]|uniref:Uncharacterized protein n=1 Tax=bioreactor metagenome TaxID=1076179 RepID=A0A644XHF8_9ZZZZ
MITGTSSAQTNNIAAIRQLLVQIFPEVSVQRLVGGVDGGPQVRQAHHAELRYRGGNGAVVQIGRLQITNAHGLHVLG